MAKSNPKSVLSIILQNNVSRISMAQKIAEIKHHTITEEIKNDYHVIILIGSSEQPTSCQIHNCDSDTITIDLLEEKLLQAINPFDIEFKKKYVDEPEQFMQTNYNVDVDVFSKIITLEHNNCNIYEAIKNHWKLYDQLNHPEFPFTFDEHGTPILKDSWMIKFRKTINELNK